MFFGYVLELEYGKFYVGTSQCLWSRISNHRVGCGAAFTRENKVISVFFVEKLTEFKSDACFWEKITTLEYMVHFGFQNVRGYSWCQRILKKPPSCLKTILPKTAQKTINQHKLISCDASNFEGFLA